MSLNDTKIRSLKLSEKPFKVSDSYGLYLLVNPGGSRLWYLKYQTESGPLATDAMACSALMESGLWSQDAVERQMSHQERNSLRAAYPHKAEYLNARKAMMQWCVARRFFLHRLTTIFA